MKRILITGVSGFIGRSLAKTLLENGSFVYGVDIFFDSSFELNNYQRFKAIKVERDNFDAIDEKETSDIDVVYHLGWAGKLNGEDLQNFELQLSNIIMTKKLIDKLLTLNIHKFVFCGSISHYKYINSLKEEVNADIYGLSKMYAGQLSLTLLSKKGISANIALLANTFGVGDFSNKAINTLIRKLLSNERLKLIDADTLNDWVYIDDTVKGLIEIGEKGVDYKEYYIGHRNIPRFEDNLGLMKKALDLKVNFKYGEYSDTTVAVYSKVDLNALYKDTGFECTCDIEASIRKTAEWLKIVDKED